MMSTTPSCSVVILVLTAAVSLMVANQVQAESDRFSDEEKRAPLLDRTSLSSDTDYPDYQLGVRYDEYPLIVPKKRTALLMNRLILALKEAMRNEDRSLEPLVNTNGLGFNAHRSNMVSPEDFRSMDLQRRGHGSLGEQNGKKFWKCHFNPVTCY